MLTHYRKPVSLSLVSMDLPVRSFIETAATVYPRDQEQFHLLLHESEIPDHQLDWCDAMPVAALRKPRLLWLEISPHRAVMTMQGNGKYSYRHLWQGGMYGVSRYYYQLKEERPPEQFRLRNFTRELQFTGYPVPEYLRLEYELWCQNVQLGHYVLSLEIHQ